MRLEFTANALKSIEKDFNEKQSDFIFDKLNFFAENYNELVKSKQVERLTNSQASRFKVNIDIRAIFISFYENKDGTIVILDIVTRENAYDNKNLAFYNKLAKDEINKRRF